MQLVREAVGRGRVLMITGGHEHVLLPDLEQLVFRNLYAAVTDFGAEVAVVLVSAGRSRPPIA